jgi:DNA-binding transcriptional MerR regulator
MTSTFSTNKSEKTFDDVQNPKHYTDSKIEVIDYIEDKNLGFCLGNVIKYVSRAGKKHSADKSDTEKMIQDLKKARWYLDRRIKEVEQELCD